MKRFKNILFTGIIIALVLTIISLTFTYLGSGFEKVKEKGLETLILFVTYSLPLSLVNGLFFEFTTKTNATRFKRKSLLVLTFGSVIISVTTVFLVRIFLELFYKGNSYEYFINNENPQLYLGCVIISLIANLFFQAVNFYKQLQTKEVVQQKVIAGTANAKFDALKNQLDPHFLFNSLNVLSSLIEENPSGAQDFTTDLSKVYRYVLEQKNKDLILLDEELKFANYYASLLKMRFEDSLEFEIPQKAINPEARVVPLSLQLLLENCVKHNMVTSSRPLKIKIIEKDDELIVTNNFQAKSIVSSSSGVGLMNIKQRYSLLTNQEVIINQSKSEFSVQIPILKEEVIREEIMNDNAMSSAFLNAKKRVAELKEFYYSLVAYCLFVPIITFVWYKFSATSFQWFWFPIAGWGLGIIIQAIKVYFPKSRFSKWENEKIQKFMEEEKQNNFEI
jgi:sensor histidine kinase YesM